MIDFDEAFELRDAAQAGVRRGFGFGAVELAGECAGERIDDERAFAGAADAGDADEQAKRNFDVDVLQVVGGGAGELQRAGLGRLAADGGDGNRRSGRRGSRR